MPQQDITPVEYYYCGIDELPQEAQLWLMDNAKGFGEQEYIETDDINGNIADYKNNLTFSEEELKISKERSTAKYIWTAYNNQ